MIMEKDFDEIPIYQLVLRLGVPALLAQFVNVLYSVVDRIFVGHIPDVGALSIAGIGICSPILTAMTAFSSLVGIGGASVMSFSVGRQDKEKAAAALSSSFLLLTLISVLLTVLLLVFQKPLLYLLGCSKTLYPYAGQYFKLCALGTVTSLVGLGMNQFVLAQGYSRLGMLAVVIGALTNTVLDPVFIFFCRMGVRGAALATILSQLLVMVFVLCILFRRQNQIPFRLVPLRWEVIGRLLYIGSLPFMVTLLENFFLVILNVTLRRYGGTSGDEYITCATVVQSFIVFAFNPGYGLSQGCGTLYAYHYGARHYQKVMQTFQWVLIVCGIYMSGLCIFAQTAPDFFARLFLQDEALIPLASSCIRKYSAGLFILAVQYSFVDGLTSMGLVSCAMPIFLFRRLVYVAAILLIPIFLPLEQVFWSEAIGDVIGASVSVIVFLVFIRKIVKRKCGC